MNNIFGNNFIYNFVVSEVKKSFPDAYCTSTYNATPPKFPCLFLRETGNFTPRSAVDLAFAEEVSDITFEAQVFSNVVSTAKTQAYQILEAVNNAFKKLYFIKIISEPLPNADEHVFRLLARYRRIVCGGDNFNITEE